MTIFNISLLTAAAISAYLMPKLVQRYLDKKKAQLKPIPVRVDEQ